MAERNKNGDDILRQANALTGMAAAAEALKGLFDDFTRAGFTEDQALKLIGQLVANLMKGQ